MTIGEAAGPVTVIVTTESFADRILLLVGLWIVLLWLPLSEPSDKVAVEVVDTPIRVSLKEVSLGWKSNEDEVEVRFVETPVSLGFEVVLARAEPEWMVALSVRDGEADELDGDASWLVSRWNNLPCPDQCQRVSKTPSYEGKAST